jgi:hypothetical protein
MSIEEEKKEITNRREMTKKVETFKKNPKTRKRTYEQQEVFKRKANQNIVK